MFKNYFKIAWRNISKRKFYAFLNIIGLATGIVFTFLIGAYVWREVHVNTQLRNAKNQYFLKSKWKDPNLGNDITTLGPISKRLKEDYPSLIANYYRWDGITSVVTKGEKHFRESIQLGDSTLFSMYGFGLLHGDVRTALNEPFSVVITQDMAEKYFGKTDVVGESIGIQSFSSTQHDFIIIGVLKDIPENSVIRLNEENVNEFFIPTNTYTYFPRNSFENWANLFVPSYIEVKDGVTAKDLEQPLRQLVAQNSVDQLTKDNLTIEPVQLTEYYLQKNNGYIRKILFALSFTGLFILLMAIANFVNISISNASVRIKEIGVRKVMGGMKKQIVFQFLVESVIIVFIATAFALAAYPLLQPLFSQLVGKDIPALSSFPVYFIAIPPLLVIVIGIAAGLYPALVLSSLKSVDSLKGKLKNVKEKVWLRKSLAGFQFAVALIVMICAFIVSSQVGYFFGRDLGYNKEYIVSSQVPRNWSPAGVRNMEYVRNEFALLPAVSDVTLSYEIPNGMNGGQPPVYRVGTDSSKAIAMQSLATDEHYLQTYEIPLAAGSFLTTAGAFDSSKVVMNETAVKALGWSDAAAAIGQQVTIPASGFVMTIIGITKDFHFNSMVQKIQPSIFFHSRLTNSYRYLSFRIKPGQTAAGIASIEKKWASLLPGSSFEYRFMDEVLEKLYKSEIQLKKASYTATVLSLVIVLLGILGLVSLNVQKRTKEIGIRKVLGASIPSIIFLFMKEFIAVILVAAVIACPVAWLMMQSWLKDYAYRITASFIPFLAALLLLAFTTLLLIVLQTMEIGFSNPVKSLRTE
ncbi:MAG: FtsX-like permease family protein [Ferruginibacter sp.]